MTDVNKESIAVVGIGCRFPGGASSPKAFWNLLRRGKDAIVEVPSDRWDVRRFYDEDPDKPGKTYVKQGGFLKEKIDRFDPMFFGISPREAESMDPQQRLLLEVTWEAFEDAGVLAKEISGSKTGVFIGGFCLDSMLMRLGQLNRELADSHSAASSTMTILSNRISYVFDLKGPSVTMDTACSSSLVSTHYACQSLWSGESEMALAGGVNVMLRPEFPIMMSKGKFLSTHGRCKAFDEEAAGYTRGEGAGIVMLKPLSMALAAGDRIYALIKETGVNQDGHTAGISMPNSKAQAALAGSVYRKAGICPSEIDYVEAHGTGTQAGDPAELKALHSVLSENRPVDSKCLVGSVKTNIGHLEASAGVAGLIKGVLSLHHETILPNLHFKKPNPKIPFKELCVEVSTKRRAWNRGDRVRYAGVNSFGYGGTNAHVLLEEAPAQELVGLKSVSTWSSPICVPISGRSEGAARELAAKYAFWLTTHSSPKDIADFCFTVSKRRSHHSHRFMVIAENVDDLLGKLQRLSMGEVTYGICCGVVDQSKSNKYAFIYTGMGPQWWAMGRQLFEAEAIFRDAVEECDAYFIKESGWSILKEMLADESESRMNKTEVAQPANFVIQVGLTALWKSWGLEPDVVIGHSVGEVGSAYASGALSIEDAMKVSFHRSRLQQSVAGLGAMLAAGMSEEDAAGLVKDFPDVSIAAINGPATVTLSGDSIQLERISNVLTEKSVFNRLLTVEVAYHSNQMDPIKSELLNVLSSLEPRETNIPLYSTVTGDRVEGTEFGTDYWWHNVREPVKFAHGIARLLEESYTEFIEIGPHPVLGHSVKEIALSGHRKVEVIPSLNRKLPEHLRMLNSLGEVFCRGAEVNWSRLIPEGGRHITLPTYPWQKDVYWRESDESRQDRLGSSERTFLNQKLKSPQLSWSVEVNSQFFPFLKDHVVNNQVVFPGAAYVEAGLSVSREIFPGDSCVLSDIEFHNMLLVEGKKTQEISTVYSEETRRYSVYSRTGEKGADWLLHASGRLVDPEFVGPKNYVDLRALKDAFSIEVKVEAMYLALEQRGLFYGDSFRCAKEIWTKEDEVIVRIQKLDKGMQNESAFVLDAEVLDSAFHSILMIVSGKQPYVPVSLRKFIFKKHPGDSCWFHGIVFKRDSGSLHADLYLINDDGEVCVEIKDAYMKALPKSSSMDRKQFEQLFYRSAWNPFAFEANSSVEAASEFVVFSNGDSFGGALLASLKKLGKRISVVYQNQEDSKEGAEGIVLGAVNLDEFSSVFDQLKINDSAQIIYLWSMESSETASVSQNTITHCTSLMYLVQAIKRLQRRCTLTIASVNGQSVAMADDLEGIEASALWGLGAVVENECELIRCHLVDFESSKIVPNFSKWLDVILYSDTRDIAFRGAGCFARFLGRCSLTTVETKSDTVEILSPDEPFILVQNTPKQIESLVYKKEDRIQPGKGEVELKVYETCLSRMFSERLLGGEVGYNGSTVRSEIFGVVVAVGEGVDVRWIGKHALTMSNRRLRRYYTVSIDNVVVAPKSVGESCHFVFSDYAKAYYALVQLCRLQSEDCVLIHDATDAFGLAAINICRLRGARFFATANSEEKRDFLVKLGVERVWDAEDPLLSVRAKECTDGNGVSVLLNSATGESFVESLRAMASFGRCVDVSKAGGQQAASIPKDVLNRNISYSRLNYERVLNERFQDVMRVSVEIVKEIDGGKLGEIETRRYSADGVKGAFRYLEDSNGIGRVVVNVRDEVLELANSETTIGEATYSGTYLITGGTGGFGLALAEHLAENGVERLVLLSRRGCIPEDENARLQRISERGVEVVLRALDVVDSAALKVFIDTLESTGPAIKGIVHGAMVLDDQFIETLTTESLERVMLPKIEGAVNLYEASKGIALDNFVMFSSISSMVGNRGQANYIAANAFLDAYAFRLVRLGVPAKTINWGVLSESGVVSRNKKVGDLLKMEGITGLSDESAFRVFDAVLASEQIQVGAFDVDWDKWSQSNPIVSNSSRISSLVGASGADSSNSQAEIISKRMLELEEQDRYAYVEGITKGGLSAVLKIPSEKIDTNQTLTNLGIDSLLLIELTLTIQDEFGINIPAAELMKYPTISDLTNNIVARLSI